MKPKRLISFSIELFVTSFAMFCLKSQVKVLQQYLRNNAGVSDIRIRKKGGPQDHPLISRYRNGKVLFVGAIFGGAVYLGKGFAVFIKQVGSAAIGSGSNLFANFYPAVARCAQGYPVTVGQADI